MSNHCFNTLTVSMEMVQKIVEKYIGKDDNGDKIFDFDRIVPVGDVPDWYEQHIEKWGTKSAGYDLNIGKFNIDFVTAWSPPVPIIKKLAELHKDYLFCLEYYEPGMAFRGIATAEWRDMTEEDFEELGFA